ncbi:formimidoyltransferase-cyclodeaminase-like isoform X1 [Asterias rubens]|uniref:formimidoyltransferase-cyclodeaminase-like isoform X1 n=2 Tax=Asterias rubens TaxID=7604 RepID=UPI00145599CF|nr:formimidoyltransferase-cyclodeaminase-like isoform X1 [Asterias rubens]
MSGCVQIVECVPNFSEGRSKEVIDAIAEALICTQGCHLLDVDPGPSTNRTVYTFVGSPSAVVEGALNMARVAAKLIDMRGHHGEHPRMGALDVCPFIPVNNTTMEDCVGCAKEFGSRLAQELGVPVYLYANAACEDKRKILSSIRDGEYEKMPQKLANPDWYPDYGTNDFIPTWGATATGARKFLIAFNVNLLGTKEQAHRIALNVREQGRDPSQRGTLKSVQGIGWWLDEANLAQVSLNLLDMDVTPLHQAFEECKKFAEELNVAVCGSQIVGLVPRKAILEAADFYIQKENLFILEEDQKIRLVIDKLGLSSLSLFKPNERIVEYMIAEDSSLSAPLANMSLKSFIKSVGSRTPAPGGGSVAAAVGAMGAALTSMVGWLSFGNKKFEHLDAEMRRLIPPLNNVMQSLVPLIDADTNAFNGYMAAIKMPKSTEEETKRREECMQLAIQAAISVPMQVARCVSNIWEPLKELAKCGNIQCVSDLQVGARALEVGVWGAYYNVMVNIPNVTDEGIKAKAKEDIDQFLKLAREGAAEVLSIADGRASSD